VYFFHPSCKLLTHNRAVGLCSDHRYETYLLTARNSCAGFLWLQQCLHDTGEMYIWTIVLLQQGRCILCNAVHTYRGNVFVSHIWIPELQGTLTFMYIIIHHPLCPWCWSIFIRWCLMLIRTLTFNNQCWTGHSWNYLRMMHVRMPSGCILTRAYKN
jgi:hypothetical protein